jgi:hypothetical protein
MDKWLKTANIRKTRDNEPSTLATVLSGAKCATSRSDDHIQSGNGKSQVKNRKYEDDYIKFRFTCSDDQERLKPRRVICGDVLANSSLKPSLLRRHLESRHPTQMNKPIDFFKHNLVESNSCIENFVSTSNDNENAQEASYRVSYRVAKVLEAHTIAENLIGPCIKYVVRCMLGEKAAKKTDIVPFSNNTLSQKLMTYQAI